MESGVAGVATGGHQTCAWKTDGSAWCWGTNEFGQLGDGTQENRSTPVRVLGLPSAVAELSPGGAHNCARTQAGAMWCWGNNDSGRIGDGTTLARSLPVPVRFP